MTACSRDSGLSLAAFYEYDRNFPLYAQVDPVDETDDYSLYHVNFRSTHDVIVPALYAVPKNTPAPHPAIILVHGIRDSKTKDYMEVGNRILTHNGYAVLRIDIHHVLPRLGPGMVEYNIQTRKMAQKPWPSQGLTLLGQIRIMV